MRAGAALAAIAAFAGLLVLGTWQLHRLSWKLDLIARVDARVNAPPVEAPDAASWDSAAPASEEYRHVHATGIFLHDRETLVQAVTRLGPGYWVVTPLEREDGKTILINRGFVPVERRAVASRAAGEVGGTVTITGLLRLTEPQGGFLRTNDPAANRWFSRDVAAISAARHMGAVAPFFIDADAKPNPGSLPVGGLTVVTFPNNHLVYALTWYGLAALLAGYAVWSVRERRRRATQESSLRTV